MANRALSQALYKLELQDAMYQINNQFFSREWDLNWPVNDTLLMNEFSSQGFNNEDINISFNSKYVLTEDGEQAEIVVLSGDSLIHQESYPLRKNKEQANYIYNPKQSKKLRSRFNKGISNRAYFVDSVLQKMMSEPQQSEKRINKSVLDSLLSSEFENHGINFKYEYSVFNPANGFNLKTDNFNSKAAKHMFKRNLFPNDIVRSSNFIHLYFPSQKQSIFLSLGFMNFSTLFLTLVLVFGFSFTFYVIFRQKKLSEMKTDFINNMTHELKTPISTISLASQMLKDKSITKDASSMDHISHVIEDESKRLSYQVEKVLHMAVFEKGQLKLNFNKLDLNTLVGIVTSNFELQVRNKKGRLVTYLDAENSTISADEVHLSNVLFNLLDNAVKYCHEDPHVVVGTKNTKDGIAFYVEDNGIGMNKESISRIFDKFYRVHTGNVHNVKGFGLGLSYVKKIIDEHFGKLKVDSEVNKGSKFEIILPLYSDESG